MFREIWESPEKKTHVSQNFHNQHAELSLGHPAKDPKTRAASVNTLKHFSRAGALAQLLRAIPLEDPSSVPRWLTTAL